MAPRQREPSIERTPEYEEFMEKLAAYHEKRGTTLEREPKAANRHLDLFRLYKRVCEEGGYDKVSDVKGNKLAWRRLATEFLPGVSNVTTQAFIVKSAYYKNLAAYEISTFHHREPPPREILEDVSAKGGDLLNRTVENYFGSNKRGVDDGKDRDSDGSDAEVQKTPKEDKMDIDEPGSTGRVTRALRHAPPQRVLFQPDLTSSRQTRQSSHQISSPTPGNTSSNSVMNGSYNTNGASLTIASYEPWPQIPSAVKPVLTPGNNPDHFRNLRNRIAARNSRALQYRGMMMPGTGFTGPNIYIRALLALRSGQPEEVRYALHHLVKISHERGDKYRFDGFPGLAEALIAKLLEVSSLFYDVRWEISYTGDESLRGNDVLNGVAGTSDIIQKISAHPLSDAADDIQTEEFVQALSNINEAGLLLRNMVMMEENAQYISKLPLINDFITIALNLPRRSTVVELQHYALEIAEQLTKYFALDPQDPLYHSLLTWIDSTDRGAIITSLRALARIAMNLDVNNRLQDVPISTLQQICDWLLVEDEELRNACLDFLYQYTAILDNVEILLRYVNIEGLVNQLVRLLMYNATWIEKPVRHKPPPKMEPTPEKPPRLSQSIVEQLVQIPDEREQSSAWLRTCFEEDPAGEITQIALWQAYNECFNPYMAAMSRPLMSAKDFITNVSTTFPGATAQVLNGNPPKYTIKGVKPRIIPVDQRGRPYLRCLWVDSADMSECGEFKARPAEMWEHIMTSHLVIAKGENGKYKVNPDESRRYNCHWGGCQRFDTQGHPSPYIVAKHIQTHLPDQKTATARGRLERSMSDSSTTEVSKIWYNTPTDERNDAAGLPLASLLVLRNLARQMMKIEGDKQVEQVDGGWVKRVFDPVREQLYHVMAYNFSLKEYIASLTKTISAAGA